MKLQFAKSLTVSMRIRISMDFRYRGRGKEWVKMNYYIKYCRTIRHAKSIYKPAIKNRKFLEDTL